MFKHFHLEVIPLAWELKQDFITKINYMLQRLNQPINIESSQPTNKVAFETQLNLVSNLIGQHANSNINTPQEISINLTILLNIYQNKLKNLLVHERNLISKINNLEALSQDIVIDLIFNILGILFNYDKKALINEIVNTPLNLEFKLTKNLADRGLKHSITRYLLSNELKEKFKSRLINATAYYLHYNKACDS